MTWENVRIQRGQKKRKKKSVPIKKILLIIVFFTSNHFTLYHGIMFVTILSLLRVEAWTPLFVMPTLALNCCHFE